MRLKLIITGLVHFKLHNAERSVSKNKKVNNKNGLLFISLKLISDKQKVTKLMGAGKTTVMFSISVNVLSANFPFCVVPAGGEGGGNGKYVDFTHS